MCCVRRLTLPVRVANVAPLLHLASLCKRYRQGTGGVIVVPLNKAELSEIVGRWDTHCYTGSLASGAPSWCQRGVIVAALFGPV